MNTLASRCVATLLRIGLVLALAAPLVGCDDDDDLGAPCRDDRDCDAQCARGGDFPDGMCTYACRDDRDCPGGWACVDKQGGICMYTCRSDGECRSALDSRWECSDEDREGDSGRVSVCKG